LSFDFFKSSRKISKSNRISNRSGLGPKPLRFDRGRIFIPRIDSLKVFRHYQCCCVWGMWN